MIRAEAGGGATSPPLHVVAPAAAALSDVEADGGHLPTSQRKLSSTEPQPPAVSDYGTTDYATTDYGTGYDTDAPSLHCCDFGFLTEMDPSPTEGRWAQSRLQLLDDEILRQANLNPSFNTERKKMFATLKTAAGMISTTDYLDDQSKRKKLDEQYDIADREGKRLIERIKVGEVSGPAQLK